ncbi:MAG: hypothetical protein LBU42_09620 [Prevotellaceae bacterium]|jgi:hypothetical protein|nr:hypothetical protein [Prevotellaceae bacterium]
MAVSIDTLKGAIKDAFDREKEEKTDQEESIKRLSEAIAKAVAVQILAGINSATVTPALAAPNGPVTGTIKIEATSE